MSVPAPESPAPESGATAAPASQASPPSQPSRQSAQISRTPRQMWRAARGPLLFGAALVVVALLVSLGSETSVRGDLDPESAGPEGTRALVRILADQGSEVTVARGIDDAADAADAAERNGGDSTLLLTQSHRLTPAELKRLAAVPGDRVLVQPTTGALDAFAPGVRVSGRGGDSAPEPRCALPGAAAAGRADLDGERYRGSDGAESCYGGSGGAPLVRTDADGRTTTVLGGSAFLRNEDLAANGNAALALNLLGANGGDPGDVVFAIPDVPVQGGGQTLWDLTPFSVRLSLGALAAALLLAALWRGRRLGPLVTESLPVVVRAAETTEGRAGLYASRRSRDRAAAALRGGVIGRLRPAFGLGPDAPPGSVVDAVASRGGADRGHVAALLYGSSPDPGGADPFTADDAGLVRLADELDRLEAGLR
ncbi:uncharacterized protein DUF4350 [Murinocardiopsis flavida]|uniref:Uncharacterized protein DUF4350 n=1 Tax=Murinocardiopsis flavida TaxID=645275 RepID=A0A2P8DIR3_9ACTN|nr:DUF4350 domain-containing protein [Murinocardiopsis flavida]PSK97116.1 uncharacterized protein DUF4350 [Murinocardiopsis flavida]